MKTKSLKWSRLHTCCKCCKTTDHPHESHGVCSKCRQFVAVLLANEVQQKPSTSRFAVGDLIQKVSFEDGAHRNTNGQVLMAATNTKREWVYAVMRLDHPHNVEFWNEYGLRKFGHMRCIG
jgi:hypothetical protein